MNLLPCPRILKRAPGFYSLPRRTVVRVDAPLTSAEIRHLIRRLQSAATSIGVRVNLAASRQRTCQITFTSRAPDSVAPGAAKTRESYALTISPAGVVIASRELAGLRAAVATLRQLFREHGRRLPCLEIRDWPDFGRRGFMLDVSRGRVPNLKTLFDLADHLADFKINELQLYTEHTFAYRRYRKVWNDWGALTGKEIRRLDTRCRELGIDLVPNQNSFGHLRAWFEHPPLKKLGEVSQPYEADGGAFLRYPSTLAPAHPGTLPFLRGLYDELLPHFSSKLFNVGCDETWDLGRGQSRKLCVTRGRGRVYLDFLKSIHREVSRRGKRMMFWGDIILKYPRLIRHLPRKLIALNWGYEANHPFERETARFAHSKIPFYVCPGTSTWMTMIGRHDNALANLHAAARAGLRHGAIGYLITDWGDGGHPQPMAASYYPLLAGAALSWCAKTFDEKRIVHALSRDVFHDATGRLAAAARSLGSAHRHFQFRQANSTPFGIVIAAPPPERRELFCRGGLECYRRISPRNIRAALKAVERERATIRKARARTSGGRILALELDLAARMASESCEFMLWQQAVAAGKRSLARRLATQAIRRLRQLDKNFNAYWPLRNKATTKKCSAFLKRRMEDYRSA